MRGAADAARNATRTGDEGALRRLHDVAGIPALLAPAADPGGNAPAHFAAHFGHADCLTVLLELVPGGAQCVALLAPDQHGCTPAMWAAKKGHVDCLTTLLKLVPAADVAQRTALLALDHRGTTPAQAAVRWGRTDYLRALFELAPQAHGADGLARMALMAVRYNHLKLPEQDALPLGMSVDAEEEDARHRRYLLAEVKAPAGHAAGTARKSAARGRTIRELVTAGHGARAESEQGLAPVKFSGYTPCSPKMPPPPALARKAGGAARQVGHDAGLALENSGHGTARHGTGMDDNNNNGGLEEDSSGRISLGRFLRVVG